MIFEFINEGYGYKWASIIIAIVVICYVIVLLKPKYFTDDEIEKRF